MGSGRCGRYSNTYGAKRNCSHEHISEGSQPYSETYHVETKMLEKDKSDPDIYNELKGYFKNPTSTLLESAIDGNRFVYNKRRVDGKRMYILDKDGNIFFGKRCNPNNSKGRSPHPTLIGGKDPIVQCAGIIDFYNSPFCLYSLGVKTVCCLKYLAKNDWLGKFSSALMSLMVFVVSFSITRMASVT